MGGPAVSYSVCLRWTLLLLLVICLCPVTTGGLGNSTDEGALQNGTDIDRNQTARSQNITSTVTPIDSTPESHVTSTVTPIDSTAKSHVTSTVAPIDSTTESYVDSDSDRVTTAGYNVTLCESGHGYPEECPQPGDPISHTKCCRNYQVPRCCEPRARKVCASKDKGLYVITAWDIDPEPEYDAIFCPGADQSDDYVSCGYTGGDMTCFSRQTSLILVWVTSIVIFALFPLAFTIFTIHSIKVERAEERQMLADGIFVRREVEIEERMIKKKAEKAAAAKAAEKLVEKENQERERRKRAMVTANGRKKSSANIELANGRKESSGGIEANGRKESSGGIEVNGRKESSGGIEANRRKESSENIEVTSTESHI